MGGGDTAAERAMTIIAVKDGYMAADSGVFSGSILYQTADGHPKIVRAPDGSLVAASGTSYDTYLLREWAKDGMNFADKPKLSDEKDDPMAWLWLRPDETVWRGNNAFNICPCSPIYAIGIEAACQFAEGAMWAGKSAAEAVQIAIEHCIYVAGPVVVVRVR